MMIRGFLFAYLSSSRIQPKRKGAQKPWRPHFARDLARTYEHTYKVRYAKTMRQADNALKCAISLATFVQKILQLR